MVPRERILSIFAPFRPQTQNNMADSAIYGELIQSAVNIIQEKILIEEFRLRSEQEKAIRALYHRNDLVAVLSTGNGKSMVYQVIALMMKEKWSPLEPVILTICPFIGIIKDQIADAETVGLQDCNLSDASVDFKLLENFLNYLKSDAPFTNRLLG